MNSKPRRKLPMPQALPGANKTTRLRSSVLCLTVSSFRPALSRIFLQGNAGHSNFSASDRSDLSSFRCTCFVCGVFKQTSTAKAAALGCLFGTSGTRALPDRGQSRSNRGALYGFGLCEWEVSLRSRNSSATALPALPASPIRVFSKVSRAPLRSEAG